MAAETDITPEEKLLRVIRKGGAAESRDVPAEPAAEPAADGMDAERAVTPAVAAVPSGRVLGATCRLLVLATLLLAAGGAYELVKAVPEPEAAPPPPDRAFLEATAALRLPRVEDTIDQYARRRIFGRPPSVPIAHDPDPQVLRGWRAEVRDHYRLMGISIVEQTIADGTRRPIREAIILDGRSGNMHFVSTGKRLVIKEDHVTVQEVLPDAVVLKSDEIEMTLHKQGASE